LKSRNRFLQHKLKPLSFFTDYSEWIWFYYNRSWISRRCYR